MRAVCALLFAADAAAFQLHASSPTIRIHSATHAADLAHVLPTPVMAATVGMGSDVTRQTAPPSFNNTWYALAYSEQVGTDLPFGTRLFGEPLVLYRDAQRQPVCVTDVCPHRSAPLSMGEMENGMLRCFYHGWGFGSGGKCVDIPTASGSTGMSSAGAFTCTTYAVAEHEGMLWVWRGNPLAADVRKLPRHPAHETTFTVDTTLDYGVDWSAVVEDNLQTSRHSWMSDGSKPLPSSHDAPNIVRHGGASGISQELHVLPIAPDRTRVLLRHRFPKGPIISTLLAIPGALELLSLFIRNRNYEISREGYPAVQAQARGSGGAGANDLVSMFRQWKQSAEEAEGAPDFERWDGVQGFTWPGGIQIDDDAVEGTYGLKKSYVQTTPPAEYAPIGPLTAPAR